MTLIDYLNRHKVLGRGWQECQGGRRVYRRMAGNHCCIWVDLDPEQGPPAVSTGAIIRSAQEAEDLARDMRKVEAAVDAWVVERDA